MATTNQTRKRRRRAQVVANLCGRGVSFFLAGIREAWRWFDEFWSRPFLADDDEPPRRQIEVVYLRKTTGTTYRIRTEWTPGELPSNREVADFFARLELFGTNRLGREWKLWAIEPIESMEDRGGSDSPRRRIAGNLADAGDE